MINVQSSSITTPLSHSNVTSLPVKLVHSIAPHVIELFKTLNDRQTRTSDAPRDTQPSQTQPLIEQLLRFAVSPTQPSLAEQISQLVENAPEPLTDPALRNEVEQRLNQPSALNPQRTYAQLIQTLLESPPHGASNVNRLVSRSRRDLRNLESAPASRAAAIRAFADALVDRGDRQLAINVANSLIRQRLDSENRRSNTESDKVDVPADSTFGQAWGELADALNAEPFKSFAEARKIDIFQLIIHPSGTLSELRNNRVINFHLHNDADWAAASGAVLAAVKKLSGERADPIVFYGRTQASAYNIASFYGLQLGSISGNDTLFSIGQLLRDGTFTALSSTDELFAARYAPIRHQQREAGRHIAQAPMQQLNERLAEFAHAPAAQKVQEADQTLARLCSQGLMKLVPGTGANEFPVMIKDVPEYSTFNQMRKQLLAVLTGDAFTAFAREKSLDPASVRINPVSGDLTGKVNNVDTTFTANDLSGWFEVWSQIKGAVQQWAAGSQADVTYPSSTAASLYDVMRFYNESIPSQQDTRQHDWRQRQLIAVLTRSTQMTRNNGFQALLAETADSDTLAVKARQQSLIQQLTDAPLLPSPLEALAAAVESHPSVPVNPVDIQVQTLESADRALAVTVHQALLELKTDPGKATSKMIESIPANSLFGRWQAYLSKALKAPGFTDWARKHEVELTSLRFDPSDKALIGTVKGVDQRFTAQDFAHKYPEHFDVLAPVLNAAEVFSAHGKTITLVQPNHSAPLEWLSSFYGISNDPTSMAFARQTESMGRTQQFPKPPEHPERMLNRLNTQRTALGNSYDRYELIGQLKSGIINRDETQSSMRFVVDPDSSHHPKGVKTARAFLTEKGWKVPQENADTENLLLALRTPLPQSPPLGNLWGFLSTRLSLSTEQRVTVGEFVKTSTAAHDSLLSYLSANVTNLSTDPEQALDQLVSSDAALELAAKLESQMKGAPTATSRQQWLLTALVLEIDPTAGAQHKTVAGIDLMGAAYSGHSVESIREQFGRDLAAKKGIPANLAPAIARLMISGMAPQLLVKEVPRYVTLGSPEWVNFTSAVNRIEWTAPGATQGMTYQQIMNHNNIKPISALEAQIQNYAHMNPLLDWAALNNNVNKDNYTLQQLKDSQVKLQAQTRKTAESISWLSKFDPPNRRTMTLEILRKEFGTGIDYERRYMIEDVALGIISGRHYSLAEIYEAGRLGENWLQEGKHVDFGRLRKRANEPKFPVVNDEFDKAIKEDFHLRRRHTVTLFENMLKKLPVEEHKSLLYGDVEFLNVEGTGSGMVMTSVYNGVRRDFAVYPASGLIVRIADIDPSTPLGQKVSLEIDAEAFKNGTIPKPGVKSEVILRVTDQHLLDDNDEPWPLEVAFPAHSADDRFSPNYARGRISKLAKVMVDSTYLNNTQFLNLHRNWTTNRLETATEPSDFFKAIWHALPGTSSLEDLYHGQFFKAGVDLAIDIAIYAATEGAGKLWTLAKSGASWAAAKISAGFIEKWGAREAESIALTDMTTASMSESYNAIGRLQGPVGTVPLSENMIDGSVTRSGTQETSKLSAIFQDDEWYALNTETMAAEGPALKDFVPQSDNFGANPLFDDLSAQKPDENELINTYKDKVTSARKDPDYKLGYANPNLKNILGYASNMGPKSIAKLIAESDFTAEQIGGLIRQREKILMDNFQRVSEGFMREMSAVGASARVMPQTFYLSLTQLYSRGECAGISTAMATALSEGTENTLLDNLTIAAAQPELTGNSTFLRAVTELEDKLMLAKDYHSTVRSLVPYDNIIQKMSKATDSTIWSISSQDHAMVAGIRVDPLNANKKTWFFYEPNYGLAKFESENSMKAGMKKLLKAGPIGSSHIHYGTASKPIYGMSVFDVNDLTKKNLSVDGIKNLSQPLVN